MYVDDVDHHGTRFDAVGPGTGLRSGALHHDFAGAGFSLVGAEEDLHTGRSALAHQPLDKGPTRPGNGRDAAELVAELDQPHPVASGGRHPSRLQPGRATTDHDHVAGPGGGRVPVRVAPVAARFVAGARFADTGDDRVAGVAHLARLVAEDARPDAVAVARAELGHKVGVGELGTGHLHPVAHPVGDGPLGLTPVHHRALQEDRRIGRGERRPDFAAYADVVAGGLVEVGPGLIRGVDRTAHHDHIVEAGVDQRCRDGGRHLRGDACPGRQLVAAEAQPDDGGARRLAHRLDDLTGEQEPVAAPDVVALVGEPTEELAHEAVLSGVDLHPVAASRDCQPRGGGEPGDHLPDVVGFHPLGHLASVHLGHPARRPQRGLAVGTAALAAGVVEGGDDQRAVGVAGGGDGAPPIATTLRERCTFVGPVAGVDAGPLGDDHPAATTGPPFVVGGVAGGEESVVVAEVGYVGAEHHSVGGCGSAQRERLQQMHRWRQYRARACAARPTAPYRLEGA